MDFGAESAPSPHHEEESPYQPLRPGEHLCIGPAEERCGDLKVCDIDQAGREAVMSEMVVAGDSEIGTDKWFQNAVELNRFFKGGPLDGLT
eukprot:5586631-Heterocapsa_arctica.AAC.1